MKKTSLRIAALTIASSLSLLVAPAQAAPGDGHEHDHGHSHDGNKEISIPETRVDLWTAIQTEHAALLKAVETKADAAVHDSEARLQAFLKALPKKAADLEEATRRRIEGQARNLAVAYGSIHHAADDKAWDKATSEMKKADGSMKLLSAQMPK